MLVFSERLKFLWMIAALVIGVFWCYRSLKQEKGFLVINVLDAPLYADCHIAGSINIPFDKLEKEIQKYNRGDEIVLYCSNFMCTASHAAAQMLVEKYGFLNVFVYSGGMADWYQRGYPIQGPCRQEYLRKELPSRADGTKESNNGVRTITAQELKKRLEKSAAA